MKKILTILFFIYFIPKYAMPQNDTIGNCKYRCIVFLENTNKTLRGEIYQVRDSFIIFKHYVSKNKKSAMKNYELVNISVINIEKIKVIKKGMPGKGFLIGGASGLLLGGAIGFLSGDDNPADFFSSTAEEKAIGYGVLLFIPGSLIGFISGNAKLQMSIYGKYENYLKRKVELSSFSIRK